MTRKEYKVPKYLSSRFKKANNYKTTSRYKMSTINKYVLRDDPKKHLDISYSLGCAAKKSNMGTL